MNIPPIKRGDTLVIQGQYKQSNGSPVNITGYTLDVNIMLEDTTFITVSSTTSTANRVVEIVDATQGTFKFTMFDTDVLVQETYYVDIKYTSPSGYEQSSPSFKLKVKSKLV